MQIAILTFDGFNEPDSFGALQYVAPVGQKRAYVRQAIEAILPHLSWGR